VSRTPRPQGAAAPRAQAPRAAAATDPGRERRNNEDRVLCEPDLGIYAVIDGVGGESAGEIAADIAVDVLRARLSRRTTDAARLVREAIALANRQIYERAKNDPGLAGMSCVLTVAVLDTADPANTAGPAGTGPGQTATVGHVGDSRLYALAPGEIRKVTADHSPVGAREDAGDLSEAEAMRHPRRNEIYRDVGSAPHEPEEAGWIDVLTVPFPADGALLFCSDGLSDMVPAAEIRTAVEKNAASPEAAVRTLIERANAAGGKDNISVVLVTGDRYAEAVRRHGSGQMPSGQRGTGPAVAPIPLRGAARARPSLAGKLGKLLLAAVVLAAVAAGVGFFFFREPFLNTLDGILGGHAASGGLVVGIGDGGLATISEALLRAKPGQTIEVAPGTYRERLTLRDGVRLAARTPRTVVLQAPEGAGSPASAASPATPATRALPAISATGVHGARVEGFRVEGSAAAPWSVGVRLDGSEVEIDGVEVGGATGAGIEIRGADRSTVRYSYLHGNGGPGVAVSGDAAPRLLDNLIAGNGIRPGANAPGSPGVEVRGGAVPLLSGNRFEGNGGGGVSLPSPERVDEVFRWNAFGTLSREQAVRVAGTAGNTGSLNPAKPAPPAAAPPAGTAPAPAAPRPTGGKRR